jgi:hypothetical protein
MLSLGFGGFSDSKRQDSPEKSTWVEFYGLTDHTNLVQPSFKVFQSQIETFKFPVDQFCFTSFPFSVKILKSRSLIIDWWKKRLVFFDISRVLYPFHFFW